MENTTNPQISKPLRLRNRVIIIIYASVFMVVAIWFAYLSTLPWAYLGVVIGGVLGWPFYWGIIAPLQRRYTALGRTKNGWALVTSWPFILAGVLGQFVIGPLLRYLFGTHGDLAILAVGFAVCSMVFLGESFKKINISS